ncbi:hypothetical protein CC1G_03371 [Coprinopsis cinerea okayama7|uniref:Uncharacterized protein n=1 Tax=Coprinopsis cinerea (strain Okayama-7 / 130 / ATCC MYA-4618 / FGSC 9003) TaxID=240176 RepID=A8NR02_COPC7|nr:hypothetical protein CC1G_03371 [Coprinopsis cinerea okayama7\|eukprot:XP_001835589.1 hypothetical protein CC1G_03371 [Coprinopsis cinerea okayama7\
MKAFTTTILILFASRILALRYTEDDYTLALRSLLAEYDHLLEAREAELRDSLQVHKARELDFVGVSEARGVVYGDLFDTREAFRHGANAPPSQIQKGGFPCWVMKFTSQCNVEFCSDFCIQRPGSTTGPPKGTSNQPCRWKEWITKKEYKGTEGGKCFDNCYCKVSTKFKQVD